MSRGFCAQLATLALLVAASPAPAAAPAPKDNPGVFESIGRFFDKGATDFRDSLQGAKRRMDDLGDEAAANTRDLNDKAAAVGKGAADATKGAVDVVTKSRVMAGRERCVTAPNGAPDCVAAAEQLGHLLDAALDQDGVVRSLGLVPGGQRPLDDRHVVGPDPRQPARRLGRHLGVLLDGDDRLRQPPQHRRRVAVAAGDVEGRDARPDPQGLDHPRQHHRRRHAAGLAAGPADVQGLVDIREGLAAGKFEVVHSAVDNALAMIEVAKVDVVIVSGGDGGTNEFIVGKGLNSYADVRGKALVTDAPNTAYALQAKKILLKQGLKDGVDYRINAVGSGPNRLKAMLEGGDNAAAIMNLPFSAQAIEAGMKSLGRTVDLLGPYQAGGAFVLRSWAKQHPDMLERYLAGYISSLRWVLDKSHREEAIALLMSKRNLTRSLAERSYDLMIEPGFGFNPDAKLSTEGFDNVLKLRQEVEGGPAPDPAKYLDLTYYDRALKRLAQ